MGARRAQAHILFKRVPMRGRGRVGIKRTERERERERERRGERKTEHLLTHEVDIMHQNARNNDRKIVFVQRREREERKSDWEKRRRGRELSKFGRIECLLHVHAHRRKITDNHFNYSYWHVMNREYLTSVGSLTLLKRLFFSNS